MASLLEDLEAWVILNGKATADGVDIFRDYVPDMPNVAVFLNEYDSVTGDIKSSNSALRYVQVSVRASQPTEARHKCNELFHLFNRSEENVEELPSGRWALIYPKQAPLKLDQDENDRVYYGFNVALTTNVD